MTSKLDLDLDFLKMYLHTNSEICTSRLSKVTTRTVHTHTLLCFFDLDLNSVTLTYKLDLDILSTYLRTKMDFLGGRFKS